MLLVLTLVALVACQLAAAAQVCGPIGAGRGIGLQLSLADAGDGCHGMGAGEIPGEASDCHDVDKAPDWGKQPAFQPLVAGSERRPLIRLLASSSPDMDCMAPPGQAPPLIGFCRLLI